MSRAAAIPNLPESSNMFKDLSFVVPAAGAGLRMGKPISKQYLRLQGKTILQHTLDLLLSLKPKNLVLVVSPNDETWRSIPGIKSCMVVNGGATRADSVLNGLKALAKSTRDEDWVMVHDCVRPCLTRDLVERLYKTLQQDNTGGILALPVVDTLKQVAGEFIQATVVRENYYQAQTPQMFRLGMLSQALETAVIKQLEVTDECSAMEQMGHKPRIVPGHRRNLKITHLDDLALAAFYLAEKKENEL